VTKLRGHQDTLVATGCFGGYPDNYNSRNLFRGIPITTDITDTVGQAILGTTVGCARCHNHKTDKFTQQDYTTSVPFLRIRTKSTDSPAGNDGEREYDKHGEVDEATRHSFSASCAIAPIKDQGYKISQRALSDR